MNWKSPVYLIIAAMLLIGCVFGACAQPENPAQETPGTGSQEPAKPKPSEPIKVGLLLDLTGTMAMGGIDSRKGLELCFELADYKVAGKPIELVVEDAASDAGVSLDKARKLVEQDKVAIMTGPINGGGHHSVTPYMAEAKIPNLCIVPVGAMLREHDWTFMLHGTTEQSGYATGTYAHDVLGYKTASTLTSDFIAGHAFIGAFKAGFVEKGGQIASEVLYPLGEANQIPYLITAKQADCLVTWWPGADAVTGIKQAKEIGLKMPIVQVADGGTTASPEPLKALGADAIGVVAGTEYTYTVNSEANKKFVEAYKAKYGELPPVKAGVGYSNAMVILAALEATNGDTNPEALYKALRGIKVETPAGFRSFPNESNLIADLPFHIFEISKDIEPVVKNTIVVRLDTPGDKLNLSVQK